MTYKPKFPAEVYLRFLASCTGQLLNIPTSSCNKQYIFQYFFNGKRHSYESNSLEECLDHAIIETGFNKSL